MDRPAYPWLSPEGAAEGVLRELQSAVSGLPAGYLDLLRLGNGGEVGLTVSPFNLCLDSAEDALDYWNSGTYPMNGVFVFGGDGGGSALAFDMRGSMPCPVISFQLIGPDGSVEQVAPSWESFLTLIDSEDAEWDG
ncbi:MAG TPA: SMI1/KNR4 family protein [Longimicrobium sp.]|jgi:hypothetical protein